MSGSTRNLVAGLALVLSGLSGPSLAQTGPRGADPTLVRVDTGLVRGAVANEVASFKGIPYAAPPVGPLRWRAPRPAPAWDGERAATAFGPACIQADDVPQSEDCLSLNVWRPAAPPAQGTRLPVIVWIHGGALVHGGTALYPADGLARQDVVVVSMNYRMGRLGFFAHPALAAESPDDPRGNYGHMDQLAALQWVQRNIAAFGGDPANVTLLGQSAGAGAILVHLTSPLARGLFQRAILQSPGLPGPRAKVLPLTELTQAETMAVDFARSLGVMAEGAAALEALRALPAHQLTDGASAPEVMEALSADSRAFGFAGAILDGKLIVEPPEAALAAGRQAMVPLIAGANDRDFAIGAADSKDELFALFGPDALEARRLYDPDGKAALDELKQQVFADRTILEPTRHLADTMARAGQPVWWYRFAYVLASQRDRLTGVPPGFEIPFTLNLPDAQPGADKITPDDMAMARLVSGYWVAFARTGDPNGGGRRQWPRHAADQDRLFSFTETGPLLGPDPLKPRLDLWRKLLQ
jgi:para-nitrobenzyl esterase